jgi:hypothetical protein
MVAEALPGSPSSVHVRCWRCHRHAARRYWLTGPKAGSADVLIDRLPGFPDGISRSEDGNFWVALVAPVTKLPQLLRFKALRAALAWLPPWARPPIKRCVRRAAPCTRSSCSVATHPRAVLGMHCSLHAALCEVQCAGSARQQQQRQARMMPSMQPPCAG